MQKQRKSGRRSKGLLWAVEAALFPIATVNKNIAAKPSLTPPRGWIGYDGQCGICQAGVRHWRTLFERRGFVFLPLQHSWWREQLGLPEDAVPEEMKLRLANGKIHGGVDAMAALCRAVWWLAPLGGLLLAPGLHTWAQVVYRALASRRKRMASCPLARRESSRHQAHHTFFESP